MHRSRITTAAAATSTTATILSFHFHSARKANNDEETQPETFIFLFCVCCQFNTQKSIHTSQTNTIFGSHKWQTINVLTHILVSAMTLFSTVFLLCMFRLFAFGWKYSERPRKTEKQAAEWARDGEQMEWERKWKENCNQNVVCHIDFQKLADLEA